MTIEEAINLAQQHFQSGHPAETESLCRQVLLADPAHLDALNLLGASLGSHGQYAPAIAAFAQAAALQPDIPEVHANLALALLMNRQFPPAAAACRRALQLRPDYFDTQITLGNILQAQSAQQQSIEFLDAAIDAFAQAVTLRPDSAEAYFNLANANGQRGRLSDAVAAYQTAIALRPDYAQAHTNLGNGLLALGDSAGAIASHQRAITAQPNLADAYNNLAAALFSVHQIDPAIAACRHAIALNPNLAQTYNNLGNCLRCIGDAKEAVSQYQKALTIMPAAEIASNRLFTLQFLPEMDSASLNAEMAAWDRRFAQPLLNSSPTHFDPSPDRPLKIGYVSPDFCDHVVGRHILPLLREHDRAHFHITCYSTGGRPDSITARLRSHANVWRDIAALSPHEAAEIIRTDQIDILVDLSLHSAANRLLIFARKPAPVQISYLGYCGSTGLSAIDYYFSDPHIDPPSEPASDRAIRLPRTYWCYPPPDQSPQPSPPPALQNGYITFGCLNSFAKISPTAWDAWEQILRAVPRSRLLVHSPPGAHQETVRQRLGADRVDFIARQETLPYLLTYQQIDIALDPFPYGGGITTCDGLWMGVPLITLSGQTPVGCGGTSILSNLGLPEWIAHTPQQYIQLAIELARDPQKLAALRLGMRPRMIDSPLMDAPQFARDVETAYRRIWTTPR